MELFLQYAWPGNVRELKSAFEYAFVTCQDRLIEPHHLPPDLLSSSTRMKESSETLDRSSKDDLRKYQLIDALDRAKGNQSLAAELLGVSRVTVWNRMKRYGIKFTKELSSLTQDDREAGDYA
jgi:transcriptional regulator of acetoin/glycerol metabolism